MRLRRIEGPVRGLARMIENVLPSVSLALLDEHRIAQALGDGGSTADEKVEEASDAIARLGRS